jgi:hypothetical protein
MQSINTIGMPGKRRLLLDHRTALRISSNVTRNIRRLQGRTKVDIRPREVIKILNKARIRFTLVGAHGIAGWLEQPSASQVVDVIIHARHKAAVQAVRKAFPELTVVETPVVTRFIDPATNLAQIDLMKRQSDLHSAVHEYSVPVGKTHRVPSLDMALALKFAAMESPYRDVNKKRQDKVDFVSMVYAHGDEIAEDCLFSLGEMVKNGGGKEILDLVNEARAESGSEGDDAAR